MARTECITSHVPESDTVGSRYVDVHHGVALGDGFFLQAQGADENTAFRLCHHNPAGVCDAEVSFDPQDVGASIALGLGLKPADGVVQVLGGRLRRAATGAAAAALELEETLPATQPGLEGGTQPGLTLVKTEPSAPQGAGEQSAPAGAAPSGAPAADADPAPPPTVESDPATTAPAPEAPAPDTKETL